MSKISESAKGEVCAVRIEGVCNYNPETTVLAHQNGAGTAIKHPDMFACYACFACHQWLDGGYTKTHTRDQRDLEHYRATIETQKKLIDKGLIILV